MALVSDWIKLGTDFYRRQYLYALEWGTGMCLTDFMVAAGAFGGPIAVTRDGTKFSKTQVSGKPIVFIFSASGKKISSFKWSSGFLLSIGWSKNEDLVCIQDDGSVIFYDMFGSYKRSFSMGQEAKDAKVKSAQVMTTFTETMVAVLTHSNQMFVVNNVYEPRVRKYSDLPAGEVLCWCIIRQDRTTNVYVSLGHDFLVLTHSDQNPQQLVVDWNEPNNFVVSMAVSFNSGHIALLSDMGKLWMGSSDLGVKYCEYDTKQHVRPKQVAWCGVDAVILLWDSTLEIINIHGESSSYYIDSLSVLVHEADAVRVIGNISHDLFEKVPQVVVDTLCIGSMEPGALLLEASKGYQERSTRANDFLCMIKDSMEEAILNCLYASQYEYRPSTQKLLLQACLFGKSFLTELDPEPYKDTITKLRVLNAVRSPRVGLPLTWTQMQCLTMPVLLDRLVMRRLFPLALSIASFLKLPDSEGASRVLAHWACYKVLKPSQTSDDQIAKEINEKLGYTPGISYTDIANHADKVGRRQLAIKLIEYECRPGQQVPVLMRFGEDKLALSRAVESGDTDLVYTVLQYLQEKLSLADFLMLIRSYPVAQKLHLRRCKKYDIDRYRDLLVQEDDFSEQGLLRVREAIEVKDKTSSYLAHLQGGANNFKKCHHDCNLSAVEDEINLIKWQVQLEESEKKSYVNKSIHDTLYQLLTDGQMKIAQQIRSEFKVSDKKYWWLFLLTQSEANHWEELTSFVKNNKKNPIGFEPFVDACLKQNNKTEAQKYAYKVRDENKVMYMMKCGMLEDAVRVAQEQKSRSSLEEIMATCGPDNQQLQARINAILHTLKS